MCRRLSLSRIGLIVDGRRMREQRSTHTRHRQRLLNALLDISRLEFGDITPRSADFPVSTLFRRLYEEFAASAASKGLELEITSTNARVRSDPALIHEILHHLVSNAVTYTCAGRVRLRCLADGTRVRIEVHDTGIGIPADQLAIDEVRDLRVRLGQPAPVQAGALVMRRVVAVVEDQEVPEPRQRIRAPGRVC